jgi:hypothetical protein
LSTVPIMQDGALLNVDASDPRALQPNSPAPETFPDISDRQCFQQLAIMGKVTQAEALAAVKTGDMPKAVTDGIAKLPPDQQFAAQMVICGAATFHRGHEMTPFFGSFFGMGSDDLDALWRAGALLP